MPRSKPPLYVVADVHGHRSELRTALHDEGLVDRSGQWSGENARLWLLGDYVDRGPDGIGVIDDIRQLAVSAAAAGGEVHALLGNHEVQLLAAHRFGTTPIAGWDEPGGFRGGWARFGGREDDLRRLAPQHVAWIMSLPAVAVVDGHLLVHSDTARYLEFGSSVEAVNAAVAAALASLESAKWLEFCGRMSDRGAFREAESARPDDAVSTMLRVLGGEVLVHGHSTLTKYFGVAPQDVRAALRYADRRVVAIDGGVYEGGRILLTRLV
ncbi:serine/threonine protein phosphatase [Micromonospora musae]|uniref:Serine/threonine protein phosphatase n=1 Tax=Micromonospora musae TaxID=1894970 RepID=A0A3A9Y4F4_9ACTN|nr:metallophosphoesterase [Micromonospora musae]RKN20960.1 serine/threonine protein phosphatase [Micromonospora musae]RKN32228.1 serine/threonine protein phosphatase [Micromonospora musae]